MAANKQSPDRPNTGMASWKSKVIKKKGKRSVTTGRAKGIFATPLERTVCRRNRSWKMAEYSKVMKVLDGNKRRKRA